MSIDNFHVLVNFQVPKYSFFVFRKTLRPPVSEYQFSNDVFAYIFENIL